MKKQIAEVLRDVRRRRGESQAEVARRAGVSQQLVSRIERGRTSLDAMIAHARALGVAAELELGGKKFVLVHPIDPSERREIEANLDWLSRLPPAERLRTMERHRKAAERLRRGARRGI